MTFKPSVIRYGYLNDTGATVLQTGYDFPASFYVKSQTVDWTLEQIKIPGMDYVHTPQGWMGGRTIIIAGVIGTSGSVDSSGNPILTLDGAQAEAQLMWSKLNSVSTVAISTELLGLYPEPFMRCQPLQVGDSDGRFSMAMPKRATVTFMDGSQQAIELEIEFFAPDPKWYAAVPTYVNLFGGSYSEPYTFTVTPGGNARTYPKIISLTSAPSSSNSVSPYVKITTPDSSYRFVDLVDIELNGVGTLCLNFDPLARDRAIMLNYDRRLDLLFSQAGRASAPPDRIYSTNSDPDGLPYLMPGTNTVVVQGFLATSSVFIYRDAWLI